MKGKFYAKGASVNEKDEATSCRNEAALSAARRHILHDHGTERAGSSPLNDEKRQGRYHCAGCGAELFDSGRKYESGSGWPSFYASEPGAVERSEDARFGMKRVEIHCARCKGHLGHVFPDGPQPTGERYCTNGLALDFRPDRAS